MDHDHRECIEDVEDVIRDWPKTKWSIISDYSKPVAYATHINVIRAIKGIQRNISDPKDCLLNDYKHLLDTMAGECQDLLWYILFKYQTRGGPLGRRRT